MGKTEDMIGKKFGKLTVCKLLPDRRGVAREWLCKCECGGGTNVVTSDLNRGQTKSCGCLVKETNVKRLTTHGYAAHSTNRSPTWNTWMGMKRRCTDPNSIGWGRYGGRGISIDESWGNFDNFLKDMGERPLGKSLDRKDNDLGYYKDNCRWATPKEQILNSTTPVFINYDGFSYTKTELATKFGLSVQCLSYRLNIGMPLYEALTKPLVIGRPKTWQLKKEK